MLACVIAGLPCFDKRLSNALHYPVDKVRVQGGLKSGAGHKTCCQRTWHSAHCRHQNSRHHSPRKLRQLPGAQPQHGCHARELPAVSTRGLTRKPARADTQAH